MHRGHIRPVPLASRGASTLIALCSLLALAAPVAGRAGDPSPRVEEVTLEALRATSPVFGIPFGTSREEAVRRLAKRAHEAAGEELLVWNALGWGDAKAEQTYLAFAPERGLIGWRAEFQVEGEGAVKEIMRLTDAFCGPLGESERAHPRPPTPRPGDGPPPDVTEIRCQVVDGGVESALRERVTTSATGDRFASVRLSVWRTPDEVGALERSKAPAGPVEAWLIAHGAAPGAERPVVDGILAASAQRWGAGPETERAWVGFEGPDHAAAEALAQLVDALCAPHGGADSFTPSPLGTPDPGEEDWDPVITTTGGARASRTAST